MKTKIILEQEAKLAEEQLRSQGFYPIPLESPFLYRGDERPPKVIFKEGFYRRLETDKPCISSITENRESINCIACTKDVVYAVGFADVPGTVRDFVKKKSQDYSWVYLIYAEEGIDLTSENLYPGCKENRAKLANEVTLTAVPPERVIAAFQIKTTSNTIYPYLNLKFQSLTLDTQWQLLVTDFRENEFCSLKSSNNDQYQAITELFFAEVKKKGYYTIPWSPKEEDKDFLITHDLTSEQKLAFKLGLTKDDAKKVNAHFQVEALALGVPLDSIKHSIKTRLHLESYKLGHSLDLLRQCNYFDVYGLSKNLSYEQVHGLTDEQIDWLLLGFTKVDIVAGKISKNHILAAKNGVPVELLGQVNSTQAYGLSKNISYEVISKVSQLRQIEGILSGFTLDDVLSSWFDEEHIKAVRYYRFSPQQIRNLSKIEVIGVVCGFELSKVMGLKSENQLLGLQMGFSREDVLLPNFDNFCIQLIKGGKSVSEIRETRLNATPSKIKFGLNVNFFQAVDLFDEDNESNEEELACSFDC